MADVASPQALIRKTFDREMPGLLKALEAFPWRDKRAYAGWLLQTYTYVAHTTHLTALAASRLHGPAMPLHQRMLAHAAEEAGHEEMAIRDLKRLGFTLESAGPPLAVTEAFYQSLYFQIEHLTPMAIFGRILPLEGAAATLCMGVKADIAKVHGDGCTEFLGAHGEADPEHVEEAFAALKHVGQTDAEVIARGIGMTCDLYVRMLADLEARLSR